MRAKHLLIPVVLVWAGGCASGGGGSGGSGPASDANRPPPAAQAEPSPCGTMNGRPVQCVPTQRKAIDDAMAESEAQMRQLPQSFWETYYGYTPYWFTQSLSSSMAAPAQPDTGYVRLDVSYGPNVVAWDEPKPVNAGFQYHSFGVWNETVDFRAGLTAWSQGHVTPASAVPSSGNAKFTGQIVGLYVSPAGTGSNARADLNVDANFSTRTLGFSSTNTTVKGVANPHLNLSGTLTYAQGQSTFAGTLTNASGTLAGTSKGQFYGPAAQELGGAFTVGAGKGPETFAGAYGAKR